MRPAFADRRTFDRFQRLACGLLATEGRHTITAMMQATGRADCDWSGDYRLFSRSVWEPSEVFRRLLEPALALYPPAHSTIVASLDDTNLRKSGTHIPGVAYRRDPMSPPFQTNLIRAQRFVQISLAVPFDKDPSAARAIPVGFDHAPSAGKVKKDATPEEVGAHRERTKAQSLSSYGVQAITRLREALDESSRADSPFLVAVDGSYTNKTVLRHLPARTHLIGRIRKDAVLYQVPTDRPDAQRGRPRTYGPRLPTPEELRQDESTPWTSVRVFAAGREHDCDVKQTAPLLWRKAGCDLPLRVIVIRPLGYRLSKSSRVLYRQPAYLITTDLSSSLEALIQAYFWRWDIEVNHRDEKQLLGVGHAQVRSARSAERAPAFAVASYAMLLIAAANTYGIAAREPVTDLPKWLKHSAAKQIRLSTSQLLCRFRTDRRSSSLAQQLPNFEHFAHNVERHMKLKKGSLPDASAIQFAMN